MDKAKFKNGNGRKSETFFGILNMLRSVYENNAVISEAEMELLAQDLENSINGGYSAADVLSTVSYFWQALLYSRKRGVGISDMDSEADLFADDESDEIEVNSEITGEWYIVDEMVDLLEINEKNAHALYRSFVDEYVSYNAFVRLVTDFREYLTPDELSEVFDTAGLFDKELVDCYRDD